MINFLTIYALINLFIAQLCNLHWLYYDVTGSGVVQRVEWSAASAPSWFYLQEVSSRMGQVSTVQLEPDLYDFNRQCSAGGHYVLCCSSLHICFHTVRTWCIQICSRSFRLHLRCYHWKHFIFRDIQDPKHYLLPSVDVSYSRIVFHSLHIHISFRLPKLLIIDDILCYMGHLKNSIG